MKTLNVALRKGGTGKSTIATQLAFYLCEIKGKEVLYIDLDDQCSTTELFKRGGKVEVAPYSALEVFFGTDDGEKLKKYFTDPELESEVCEQELPAFGLTGDKFIGLLPASHPLGSIINFPKKQTGFTKNLLKFLQMEERSFDFCIIDTPPVFDVRQAAAFAVSDFVIAPTEAKQESIQGLLTLLEELMHVKKIKEQNGKKLEFIGFLPNRFDKSVPNQVKNLKDLIQNLKKFMIPMDKRGHYAFVYERGVLAEAQELGIPFWKVKNERGVTKSAARSTWGEIAPVFETIYKRMEG
jgi:chromosome partitioning protein